MRAALDPPHERCPICETDDPEMPNPIVLGGLLSPIIKVCDHPWHTDPWKEYA